MFLFCVATFFGCGDTPEQTSKLPEGVDRVEYRLVPTVDMREEMKKEFSSEGDVFISLQEEDFSGVRNWMVVHLTNGDSLFIHTVDVGGTSEIEFDSVLACNIAVKWNERYGSTCFGFYESRFCVLTSVNISRELLEEFKEYLGILESAPGVFGVPGLTFENHILSTRHIKVILDSSATSSSCKVRMTIDSPENQEGLQAFDIYRKDQSVSPRDFLNECAEKKLVDVVVSLTTAKNLSVDYRFGSDSNGNLKFLSTQRSPGANLEDIDPGDLIRVSFVGRKAMDVYDEYK